ncbi:MAG TPA: alanine racemase [Casimicrobiaceae bacterium]|nr:alanine racemase [Casimicrobiaceae bacterium]
MARPLVAHVDLGALAANLARVRALAPGAAVRAVVKANAYGHGLVRVLPALDDADGLALIEIDAAVGLRDSGYRRPILLLEGFFDERELGEIASRSLSIVVHDVEQLRMLEHARLSRPLEIWVKINTGMNRLGLAPHEVASACARLEAMGMAAPLRLMTHFACADEAGGIAGPLARFHEACGGLPYARSLANSAGVFRHGEVGGDIVRPGIMLYGATPFAGRSAADLGLAPAMTLRSKLIGVQTLSAGDRVGYGSTFAAAGRMRIGVVACGYADGYPRHAPNGTPVMVEGRRVPLAGRVSMDMLTVDLSEVPQAGVGSEVVLWGQGLPVDEVAAAAGTIGYELLCAVAPRVAFATASSPPGVAKFEE